MPELHFTALFCQLAMLTFCVFTHIFALRHVVGYNTITTSAESGSFGPQFAQIGTTGATYKLGDFTADGSALGEDQIQFLDPNTASVTMYATYADEENYGEMAGWWDPDNLGGTKLDDETFAAGTAFLCLFTSGNEVTFRFSGQVEHGRQIVTDTESAFICNPMPVNFTLGEITAIGSSLGEDQIQFLDPNTANVSLYATYADEENYGEMAGWWDPDDLGGTKLDDTPLPAGAAFLCLFTSGNEVTFEFPDPIPAK